jgi:CubicO group peptidase (beta-lactamase class C family)
MLNIRLVVLVLTLISLHFFNVSFAKNTKQQKEFNQLESKIAAVLKKHNVTGLQLTLNNTDGTLWNMNFGLASQLSDTLVNDDTLFRIGSISKTVTAVAVMQLVEQGKIGLNTPVQTIIPEIAISNPWQEETPITVLHLLEHTAGFDDNHFKEFAVSGKDMSTKDALDYHPHTRVARYEPGQFMSYANVDPTLLAYMVEKLSGMRFEDYVKQNIFEPLGMSHSSYFFSDRVKRHIATGYVNANDKLIATEYEFIKDRASGAINSNAADISKFQQMLINKGGYLDKHLLKQSTIERMAITESTLAAKAGFQDGYSKYLITQHSTGDKWLGHSGEMIGFLSAMWHSTSRDVGYMFVTNTSGNSAYDANREINDIVRAFIVERYPADTEIRENKALKKNSNNTPTYSAEIVGEYRQYTSRIALLGFIEGLESFSSVTIENDLVKLKTSHSTYTLVSVGHNVFQTHLDNGDEINVIFIESNGEWYYQIPSIFINAIKTPSLTKIASYTVLVSFIVMAIIVNCLFIIRIIFRLFRKKLNKSTSLGWLALANLNLFSCFVFLGSAGNSGMPLNILGQPSIQSVGVSISLFLFFVFNLISIIKFRALIQKDLSFKKSKALVYVTACAIFTNVVMLFTLIYFDFLFVMLWQY